MSAADSPISQSRGARQERAGIRRDPAVRTIIRSWRELADSDEGAATLIACSGGADSSALAIALTGAGGALVLAHVVHDLRPADEAAADRDRARELADRLRIPFVEAAVAVARLPGNTEANARKARYAALAALARDQSCRFVATAHHAGDQAESLLMHLLRGAGPRGLSGIAASRSLGRGGLCLIRPMLGVGRLDCERICRNFGWAWSTDATNGDTGRTRANLRHRVLPALDALVAVPGLERRLARTAAVLSDAAGLVEDAVDVLWTHGQESRGGGGLEWPRALLCPARPIVLGALLRRAGERLTGSRRLDRAGSRAMAPCIRAIRDDSTEPRTFRVAALRVTVSARTVRMDAFAA